MQLLLTVSLQYFTLCKEFRLFVWTILYCQPQINAWINFCRFKRQHYVSFGVLLTVHLSILLITKINYVSYQLITECPLPGVVIEKLTVLSRVCQGTSSAYGSFKYHYLWYWLLVFLWSVNGTYSQKRASPLSYYRKHLQYWLLASSSGHHTF